MLIPWQGTDNSSTSVASHERSRSPKPNYLPATPPPRLYPSLCEFDSEQVLSFSMGLQNKVGLGSKPLASLEYVPDVSGPGTGSQSQLLGQ